MALTTDLCRRLGIDVPIFQAPMAGSSTPALAAAVSNAGGLGGLGLGTVLPDKAQADIRATRAATNRPIHANFFVHTPPRDDAARADAFRQRLAPYYAELGAGAVPPLADAAPPFGDDTLDALLADCPAVVSFHFGLPPVERVRALQRAGAFVMSSATSVAEARAIEANGADAVIAQGYEAGGHQGSFHDKVGADPIGTMALVPQVVDAVRIPVIAAGGVADGRGIAAALALGAQAAQIGTAFLTCPEAATPDAHRALLLEGTPTGTILTTAFTGRRARAIVNRYARDMADARDLPDFPLLRSVTAPLAGKAMQGGSTDFSAFWAGQSASLARAAPAAELVRSLAAEAEAVLARLRA
ncbi:NAD(P)H-dependent flavin oxidoreductase [Marinivivus vitaminiproducens]|uniref:NAD(P)H-dependent flavin oxidoreductase n=1 Tax=Marinivivus vitaminiproducens TaxID=3035935 RepID=UPI00279FF9D5|nr:nitronate monooxygenase [Geminicoccaceae bacterium SCSIO 64248]